jgi:hypothetical protein
MKFYWIFLFFLISFAINPAYSIDSEEIMASAEHAENEDENKKPDDDKDDPLAGAEVTIHKSEKRTVEEYRVNGKLTHVKIIPKHGYPYYLIDTDGNGSLDQRSSGLRGVSTVNTWKIFQW